ncbi:MAG: hypothetical protein U0798_00960 [Gemmataceae bacterium]
MIELSDHVSVISYFCRCGTSAQYHRQKNVAIGEVVSLILDGQTVSTFEVGSFLI